MCIRDRECTINKQAYGKLPGDLQAIVRAACQAMNNDMLAEYNARNAVALESLVDDHQVKLSRLPDSVIDALRDKTAQVLTELADKDATTARVYKAYRKFAQQAMGWTMVSEYDYLKTRKSAL